MTTPKYGAPSERRVCGCEHIDHDTGKAHPMYGVAAGSNCAAYVGRICDLCATTCMAQYLRN